MSKALKSIASLVAPILNGKVLVATALTAAAVITGNPLLLKAAIAADASALAGVLTPKPKVTSAGLESKWIADARDGIPYAVGRCAAAGNQVFMRSCGDTNKYRNYVTVYTAAGPHPGVRRLPGQRRGDRLHRRQRRGGCGLLRQPDVVEEPAGRGA
jgi:hypothetical protein